MDNSSTVNVSYRLHPDRLTSPPPPHWRGQKVRYWVSNKINKNQWNKHPNSSFEGSMDNNPLDKYKKEVTHRLPDMRDGETKV